MNVIGLMSGTSLDGLDIAYCRFVPSSQGWTYQIIAAKTIPYSASWQAKLKTAPILSALELTVLDWEYGHYLGQCVAQFIEELNLEVDLVASHGHTVFHQPNYGFTLQIGAGAALASHLKAPLVFDFRSQDVAIGGQGAPLVPVGDQLLFSEFEACLNLGGIANVSFNKQGKRVAGDICFCNMALNDLAQELQLSFDPQGTEAAKGQIIPNLLATLNQQEYFKKGFPKSLGREDYSSWFHPILQPYRHQPHDVLHTLNQHIAQQIAETLNPISGRILITGGGAFNSFLMDLLKEKEAMKWVLPSDQIIEFKEALVFAFLGYLRYKGQVNILASVTGAPYNHSSGSIIYPTKSEL